MYLADTGAVDIITGDSDSALLRRHLDLRDHWVKRWVVGKRSVHTRDAYRRDIGQYFAWCDRWATDPFAATRSHVDLYSQHLVRTYGETKQSTVARKLTSVSSFYRYLSEEAAHLVPVNPARKVARPDVSDESTTGALEEAEAENLTAAADAAGLRESAFVRLLLTTGIRVSEACGASVSDLGRDRGHRTITVTRKGGRRQKLPVPTNTAAAIDRYLAGRASGPLIIGNNGQRMTRRQMSYHLGKVARAAGIPDTVKRVTPHVLRHTATTDALDKGATLRDVQTMCGHRDSRTTNRYDRTRHDLDRSPVHLLDRPLSAPGGMVQQ